MNSFRDCNPKKEATTHSWKNKLADYDMTLKNESLKIHFLFHLLLIRFPRRNNLSGILGKDKSEYQLLILTFYKDNISYVSNIFALKVFKTKWYMFNELV